MAQVEACADARMWQLRLAAKKMREVNPEEEL
jgi:hypothetical protein